MVLRSADGHDPAVVPNEPASWDLSRLSTFPLYNLDRFN